MTTLKELINEYENFENSLKIQTYHCFKNRFERPPLMCESFNGNTEKVKVLIKDADVDSKKCGDTALIAASLGGNTETIKELVNAGADVNSKNKCGKTALICASLRDDVETIKELIKAGADVNIQDDLTLI